MAWQVGDGNIAETLNVGAAGQPIALGSGVANFVIGSAATSKVGFYGATAVVQRATAASHTTIATTVGVSTLTTGSTSTWGYSSSTQANQITAAVAEIQATLVAIGIWAA